MHKSSYKKAWHKTKLWKKLKCEQVSVHVKGTSANLVVQMHCLTFVYEINRFGK